MQCPFNLPTMQNHQACTQGNKFVEVVKGGCSNEFVEIKVYTWKIKKDLVCHRQLQSDWGQGCVCV